MPAVIADAGRHASRLAPCTSTQRTSIAAAPGGAPVLVPSGLVQAPLVTKVWRSQAQRRRQRRRALQVVGSRSYTREALLIAGAAVWRSSASPLRALGSSGGQRDGAGSFRDGREAVMNTDGLASLESRSLRLEGRWPDAIADIDTKVRDLTRALAALVQACTDMGNNQASMSKSLDEMRCILQSLAEDNREVRSSLGVLNTRMLTLESMAACSTTVERGLCDPDIASRVTVRSEHPHSGKEHPDSSRPSTQDARASSGPTEGWSSTGAIPLGAVHSPTEGHPHSSRRPHPSERGSEAHDVLACGAHTELGRAEIRLASTEHPNSQVLTGAWLTDADEEAWHQEACDYGESDDGMPLPDLLAGILQDVLGTPADQAHQMVHRADRQLLQVAARVAKAFDYDYIAVGALPPVLMRRRLPTHVRDSDAAEWTQGLGEQLQGAIHQALISVIENSTSREDSYRRTTEALRTVEELVREMWAAPVATTHA